MLDVQDFWKDLKPYATGNTFPGFLGYGDYADRVRAAYTEKNLEVLQKLKAI